MKQNGKPLIHNRLTASVITLFFAVPLLLLAGCCSGSKPVRSVSCVEQSKLVLMVKEEFTELSCQDVYDLYFYKEGKKTGQVITGNNAILPTVKRYRDMIIVHDFQPRKGKSLFQYHYLDPSNFTASEFNRICVCYEKHRSFFPELEDKIGALVYGTFDSFREIFMLPDGFFLVTEHNGNITIVDDPSTEAMTLPAEKRHFNHIAHFDDQNKLFFRKGKIVSGEKTGFFGKPVKQVVFTPAGDRPGYTGEIETLWCDKLYSTDSFGVNTTYLHSASDRDGRTLCDIFLCQ
jgi:hypothetical protein